MFQNFLKILYNSKLNQEQNGRLCLKFYGIVITGTIHQTMFKL